MRHPFFGGVHPDGRKELSAGCTPVPAPAPARVVIPLSQHIGAVCTPLVKAGDKVKMVQKIGDGEGLCVPVHASVSGTVLAVEPRRHPNGNDVLSVVIENDFQDTPDQTMTPHPDPSALKSGEIVEIIRQAGIVGMGGAAFPTDVKARSGMGKVDTLIVNACECEPYITADDVLLRARPEQVVAGVKLLRRVLEPKRTVLAVEDNKAEAIAALKRVLASEPSLELKVLPTRYPQGAEKQLIQAVTGRQVPPGGLPSAVGCAVFNAATSAAVYRAVCLGQSVTRRVVTVTGEAVREPKNLIVRIGTPFAELVEAAGGLTDDVWKVLSGGPMMGVAQADLDVPVVKGVNAVLCLSRAQNGETSGPLSCIRCGKCLTVCPMNLQPLYLYRYEGAGDLEALKRLNLTDCIECGCCAYACPGKLPLVERFRAGKRELKEGKKV